MRSKKKREVKIVCVFVCETCPHPHSDAIVDGAVEVPLVEPA